MKKILPDHFVVFWRKEWYQHNSSNGEKRIWGRGYGCGICS